MFIYLITNHVTGKQYIGQTIQPLKKRWRNHVADRLNMSLAKKGKKKTPEHIAAIKAAKLAKKNHDISS